MNPFAIIDEITTQHYEAKAREALEAMGVLARTADGRWMWHDVHLTRLHIYGGTCLQVLGLVPDEDDPVSDDVWTIQQMGGLVALDVNGYTVTLTDRKGTVTEACSPTIAQALEVCSWAMAHFGGEKAPGGEQ